MKRLFIPVVISLLYACSVDRYPYELAELSVPSEGVKCMVIGDWGRKGNINLKANAFMMNEVACRVSTNAILTTGDNFYDNGVDHVSDAHWSRSFEDVFTGNCLLPIIWYPSLGNHDARGNTQAQIDYSSVSNRWNMPSTYYDYWLEEDSVLVHFIAVDTNPFVAEYHQDPNNNAMEHHVTQADTAAQLAWLDSVLGAGNADWTVVYGHHPVYAANGRHGETEELIQKFVPIFDSHGLDVYFCGHNHSLELIKTDTKTLYVTSGGGSIPQSRIENRPYNLFGIADAGFVLSSFTADSLQIDFISKRGERLYSHVSPQTP